MLVMKLLQALRAVSIHFYTALCLGHSSFKQFSDHGKAVACSPFPTISPKRWCLHNPCKCLPSSHLQAALESVPRLHAKCPLLQAPTRSVVLWGVSGCSLKLILSSQDPLYLELTSNIIVTLKNRSVFATQEKYTSLSRHQLQHPLAVLITAPRFCTSDSLQEKAKIVQKIKIH